MDKYKVGDRILVRKFILPSNLFHATILSVEKCFFWNTYMCEWTENDFDYGASSRKIGFLRSWNIVCKN